MSGFDGASWARANRVPLPQTSTSSYRPPAARSGGYESKVLQTNKYYRKSVSASNASSMLTETALKLSGLNNGVKPWNGADDDDGISVSSFSSIATFESTFHSRQRLSQWGIARDEIGKAIKNGIVLNVEDGRSLIVDNDIVVIIEAPALQEMRAKGYTEISDIISRRVKPVLISAWRCKSKILQDAEEYETHRLLYEAFTGVNGEPFADSEGGRFFGALFKAADKHNAERLRAIINFQGITSKDYFYFTFLHLACWVGSPVMVEALLERGADPTIEAWTKKRYQPLFYVYSVNCPEWVKNEPQRRDDVAEIILTSHEKFGYEAVDVNKISNGTTALQKAIYVGSRRSAQLLLNLGANPDLKLRYETPRELAAMKGMDLNYDCVEPKSETADKQSADDAAGASVVEGAVPVDNPVASVSDATTC